MGGNRGRTTSPHSPSHTDPPCHSGLSPLDKEAFIPSVRDKLIITGHSLGGGIALLVAAMLRNTYSQTRCIALSPVGGLLDPVIQSSHHILYSCYEKDFSILLHFFRNCNGP